MGELVVQQDGPRDQFYRMTATLNSLRSFDSHPDIDSLLQFTRAYGDSGKLACGKASILHKLVHRSQDDESLNETSWRYTYGCEKLLGSLTDEAKEMRKRLDLLNDEIKKARFEKNGDDSLSNMPGDILLELTDWCSRLESMIQLLSVRVKKDLDNQADWSKLEKMYDLINGYFQPVSRGEKRGGA